MIKHRVAAGLALKYQNSLLPLYQKVVFVDWHGVLSTDIFWSQILKKPNHRLFSQVTLARHLIFSKKPDLVSAWMRGSLTTHQVIQEVIEEKHREDLLQSLTNGCKKTSINFRLLHELQKIRSKCFVVLATDNMDCFFDNIDHNKNVREGFDSLLCSSMLGVLKSEDPERFFSSWLQKHRLQFSDALLLDDSKKNCLRFEEAGGKAILVKSPTQCIKALQALFPT